MSGSLSSIFVNQLPDERLDRLFYPPPFYVIPYDEDKLTPLIILHVVLWYIYLLWEFQFFTHVCR